MRVLILIGGITDKEYIYKTVLESNFPTHKYQLIKTFDTEKYLDGWRLTGNFLNKIPFLGNKIDKHGDWLKFYLDWGKREQIRLELRKFIDAIELEYFNTKITILAHSLGCWITLGTSLNIDNLIMIGSPTGFKTKWIRKLVNNEIKDRVHDFSFFRSKKTIELYSENDIVGNQSIPSSLPILGEGYKEENTKTSHDLKEYLKAVDWSEYL